MSWHVKVLRTVSIRGIEVLAITLIIIFSSYYPALKVINIDFNQHDSFVTMLSENMRIQIAAMLIITVI